MRIKGIKMSLSSSQIKKRGIYFNRPNIMMVIIYRSSSLITVYQFILPLDRIVLTNCLICFIFTTMKAENTKYYTISDYSKIMKISRQTIYNMIEDGRLVLNSDYIVLSNGSVAIIKK